MANLITTDAQPILRRYGGDRIATEYTILAVADIDHEFERFPESTEIIVDALLTDGFYDDSDPPRTTCEFSTDRRGAVRRQWRDLLAAHPAVAASLVPSIINLFECRNCGEPVSGDLGTICPVCDAEDAANEEDEDDA